MPWIPAVCPLSPYCALIIRTKLSQLPPSQYLLLSASARQQDRRARTRRIGANSLLCSHCRLPVVNEAQSAATHSTCERQASFSPSPGTGPVAHSIAGSASPEAARSKQAPSRLSPPRYPAAVPADVILFYTGPLSIAQTPARLISSLSICKPPAVQ